LQAEDTCRWSDPRSLAWGFRLFMIQNDYVVPDRNYFAVRNALFVLA
jgi:hypothetical protein